MNSHSSSFRTLERKLSNGLPVLLQPMDGSVAALYWWNQVGSTDETHSEAGFSHFLEHMLFKDAAAKETGKASTGQIARGIESLGGDINAYTSFDQTVYHVTCAEQHFIPVIRAFSSIALPQEFLKSDFEREREVILEELRKNEDSPSRRMFQALFTETFPKHPYGRPVIGYVKTLKAAKAADLERYYRAHYVPERMGLVVVGPVLDKKGEVRADLWKELEKAFGEKVRKPGKVKPRLPRIFDAPERIQTKPKMVPFDVQTYTLALSFRVPELSHEDIPALDVLVGILGMGESSRLYQRLFYEKALVTDVSAGMYVPHDPGMIYLQADFDKKEKLEKVTREIFAELERATQVGPTAEELSRVIVSTESERLYATQTADAQASRIGFLRFVMGDLQHDREYLERMKAVDAEQVQAVAKKYLVPARMSAVLLHPKNETVEWKGLPTSVSLEKKLKTEKKSDVTPESVQAWTTSAGTKVLFHPSRGSPVFSMHVSCLGGLRGELFDPVRDSKKDWGASHLLGMTWSKGAADWTAKKIASLVEGSAASLDGFSGRNTVGIQMTGLVRDWEKLSPLFADVLTEASFPEDEVEHSKRVVLDSIRAIDDHSSQLCSRMFLGELFGEHPYAQIPMGSLESVASLDSQTLKSFHRRWVHPSRLVISVSGGLSRADVDRWVEKCMAQLSGPKHEKSNWKDTLLTPRKDAVLSAPRWTEKLLGREQLHILVGGMGMRIDSTDRWALRLLMNILGGQSGRLFIELREKKSLAYTVAPTSFEGMEAGYVGTYIATSPSKRAEAIRGIQVVLEQFAKKGPSKAELNRAQQYYLGRRAMDLQSEASIAAHQGLEEIYGLPRLSDQEVGRVISRVNARQIQSLCQKLWVDAPQVTTVVG